MFAYSDTYIDLNDFEIAQGIAEGILELDAEGGAQ